MTTENMERPPVKLAYIIDNQVVDVLYTDDRLSSIMLSNPIILDVSEGFYDEKNNPRIQVGATYNPESNTFTNPDIDVPQE
jgi:hypothetical protein